ncbi:MAG TPA: GNAT family N-acetyltransferase [Brumimicrobium sp.]|nr:GNAT family N-acetyltransferase [Brumimicrobium sp.]
MKVFTETKRLIIRELVPSDVDEIFALDSNPIVHSFIGNNPVKSKLESIQSIEDKMTQYKEYGVGRWALIDKGSDKFVGWAGLKFVTDETNHISNYYDLGYRLNPKFWGQGLATEAASAIVKQALSTLKTDIIYAMAECENLASHRVLEKIRMKCIEEIEFEGKRYKWYSISKANVESRTYFDK